MYIACVCIGQSHNPPNNEYYNTHFKWMKLYIKQKSAYIFT